ncbi:MAG: hypothetical protein ABGY75_01065 [Gemmataceae bacterium]
MPSRLGVAVILLFWLAVSAYVVRREVVPRYFADTPPRIDFVLVDELSTTPATWSVYRDDKKVGSMTSRIEHVPADDTFRFTTRYHGLKFDVLKVTLGVPSAETVVRVSRDGRLREQNMTGQFDALFGAVAVGSAKAEVRSRVENGQLVGRAKLDVPALLAKPIDEELDPVPVPDGQVLNPLMPVDRLAGVTPGRRWTIRQTDPLRDSLQLLARRVLKQQMPGAGGESKLFDGFAGSPELLAEVLPEPEYIAREGLPVPCWVIRYESADKQFTARTFVRRTDGQVLRQEASGHGEKWRFDRDE